MRPTAFGMRRSTGIVVGRQLQATEPATRRHVAETEVDVP